MRQRRRRRRSQPRRAGANGAPLPPGLEGGRYRPLRRDDVRRIHDAALTVLERTGIQVEESECRQILAAAGARLEPARDRVFLPRALVRAALQTVRLC